MLDSLYSILQSAQLRKALQTANGGVARIGGFLEVIHDFKTMIGAHGNAPSFLLHEPHDFRHELVHIGITFQVVGLHEITIVIELSISKM